jgi:hypothetical protein
MISRTSPLRQNSQPLERIQLFTCSGSEWNWKGPGLIAGASVLYRAREDGPTLRYRRVVWWNPEVPFGVVQIEDTVTDPHDNAVVYRQRLTAVRAGGLGLRHP